MYKNSVKPLLDIILAVIAFPIVGIIISIFAPIIYFEDKGPVFYKSKRIGKDGKIFEMFKLRSMKVNSPDLRLTDGSTFNSENDPRQTKIGKFLRTTSIDELPQILNVLRGEMSWIGPRPDPEDWLDKYDERIRYFLTVKPGITGYTQAYFRNESDGNKKMECDYYYAKHISFAMDVKIFFKTINMVLLRKNIYKNESEDNLHIYKK